MSNFVRHLNGKRALKKELDETRRMRGQLEKEKKQFNEKRKQT